MQDGRLFLSSDNNLTFWLTIINMVNKTIKLLKRKMMTLKAKYQFLRKKFEIGKH